MLSPEFGEKTLHFPSVENLVPNLHSSLKKYKTTKHPSYLLYALASFQLNVSRIDLISLLLISKKPPIDYPTTCQVFNSRNNALASVPISVFNGVNGV